jgi:5'-nucleotidase
MVSLLREKEHCDVVICLSHLGVYDDKALIPQTQGIDLILGGHTHTFMRSPLMLKDKDGKDVPLLHSGRKGVKVGEIDMILKAQ